MRKLLLSDTRIHLAIFQGPFLNLLFEGQKTIESRFSKNRIAPHSQIGEGDLVLVKKSGGPVLGLFEAGEVRSYTKLSPSKLHDIRENYGDRICSRYDSQFWVKKKDANYATLVQVKWIKRIKPLKCGKKDRSGWTIIKHHNES